MFLGVFRRLLAGSGFNFGFGLLLFAGSLFSHAAAAAVRARDCARSSRSAALPRRIDSAISSSVRTSRASAISSIASSDIGIFAGADVIAMQPDRVALDAGERAAEPLAALMGDRHLDLHEMAGIALEIGAAHQRPVDAGRGNLQPIGAVDRIGDIEHRRQRPRDRLAILDLHRSVGPFRHDLDGAAGFAGNLDPHQPVAHALQHRRRRPPTPAPPCPARRRGAARQAGRRPRNQQLDRSCPGSKSVLLALGWPGLSAVRPCYPNWPGAISGARLVQVIKKSGSRGAHSQYAIV